MSSILFAESSLHAASGAAPLALSINPRRVALAMLGAIARLAALGSLARYAEVALPAGEYGGVREICYRFDLDRENTLPSWYSSMTLLSCATLLALIATLQRRRKDRFFAHWALLSVTFVYLAIDESASLHEILIVPLRRRLDTGGLLYFAWVIPGSVAVAIFALAYLNFLRHLPRRTALLFLAAGATFVGGAMGIELIGGALADAEGLHSLRYTIAMTSEEVCEMLGVTLFVYALLDYLRTQAGGCAARFAAPACVFALKPPQ
jgi:hypothetical protein